MSLRPDDRSSRTRDRSSTRDRARSRSNVRAEAPPAVGYGDRGMPGSFSDAKYEVRSPEGDSRSQGDYYSAKPLAAPYPQDDEYGGRYDQRQSDHYGREDRHDERQPDHYARDGHDNKYDERPPDRYGREVKHDERQSDYGRNGRDNKHDERLPDRYGREDRHDEQQPERYTRDDRHDQRPSISYNRRSDEPDDLAYGGQRHLSRQYSDTMIKTTEPEHYRDYSNTIKTAEPELHRQYSNTIKTAEPELHRQYSNTIKTTEPELRRQSISRTESQNYRTAVYVPEGLNGSEVTNAPEGVRYAQTPGNITYTSKSYLEDRPENRRQSSVTYDRDAVRMSSASDVQRTRSSTSLTPSTLGMHRLSVSGNRPDVQAIGGLPPPSPLLEAYHGTYQSISPMPTALRLDDDLDDIPMLESSKHSKIEKKKVKLYDPEADARTLAKALNAHSVDSATVCDILPPLSNDQIWELRKEYKKQVKIQGKGINLSKHLKMKLSGNFGKVVYVTALGRWESEGYWANFFYQSHGSRRELLIESLMGRSNADIRSIKDDFKDKRYNDDLVRCMEKELKMDKFRAAILMSLEGRRQEEQDVYPQEYRDRDADVLQKAVRSSGGESAMLEIVVRRSDSHLRELLRQYEKMYGENFARVALKKSNNLVGEVIAHILNGVINKPARDALLLRHAIKDIAAHNKDDELRYELLVSRLVRLHWDRLHMMRVKKEYKERYGKYLEEELEDSTKGDFRDFICELCDVQGSK